MKRRWSCDDDDDDDDDDLFDATCKQGFIVENTFFTSTCWQAL